MNLRNRRLLAGVSVTAMTLALGTSIAMAAPGGANTAVTYKDDGAIGFNLVNATATGHQEIDGINFNESLVSSSITANVAATPVIGGTVSSSSTAVEQNALKANSTGNSVTSTADLETLAPGGIGIVNAAVNSHAEAAIVSSVVNSSINLTAATLGSGSDSYVNSDNLISANATLNSSAIASSGAIPGSFSDSTGGEAVLSFDPLLNGNLLSSQGSVAASNVQLNSLGVAGRSSAVVSGNEVSTTLTPTSAGQVLSSSVETDGNSISTAYAGNASVAQVAVAAETDAESGVNPTFNGSVAASNLQANLEGDVGAIGDVARASNVGSTIEAVIGSTSVGAASTTLSGGLSVSKNQIASSTVGNKSGSATAFGTEIYIEPGISYSGTGADGQSNRTTFDTGTVIGSNVDAGLAVLSAQSNVATTHNSETENASITSLVQNLQDGSIDMSTNKVSSSASGNDASSRILSEGLGTIQTPNFTGTAGLANSQVNTLAPVDASLSGTDIAATVGNVEDTGGSSVLADSSVALVGNSADANASGNTSQNVVALSANTLALGAGTASINGGDRSNGNVTANTGASLTNLQANHGSAVTASNIDTNIGVDARDVSGDVSNATVSNKGGRIASNANGNDGSNTLAFQGTSASGSAGIGSVQITAGGDVSAVTSDGGIYAMVGNEDGNVLGSTVTVDGNAISSDAIANRVSNAFSVTGTNAIEVATTATDSGTAIGINGGAADGAVFDDVNPTVNASLGLLNSQILASGAFASAENSGYGNLTDSLTGSSVSTSTNVLHASATGNKASNTMSLDVGNAGLPDISTGSAAAAAVANVQSRTDGSNVTSEVGGDALEFSARVTGTVGDVSSSSVAVSGNTSEAFARGNSASNGLSVAANTLVLASPSALSGINLTPSTGLNNEFGFAVTNAQASGTGLVQATQSQIEAVASVADDVLGSSVELASNKFVAGAFDNAAGNSLSIDAGTATTSGGVANFQSSGAVTSAMLGNPGVAAIPGSSYNVTATNQDPATGAPVVGLSTINLGDGDYLMSGTLFTDSDVSGVAGWTAVVGQPGWYQTTVSSYLIDTATYNALSGGDGNFDFAVTVDGTSGVAGTPSVIAQIGGDIVNSSVSVADTISQATAISNSANNTIAVAGGVVEGGSGITAPGTIISLNTGALSALSDYAVANEQVLTGTASAIAEANGTYAVAADDVISGSSVSVTGTRQQATAEGNQVTNGLSLSATNLDGASPSASLASSQTIMDDDDAAAIAATSWMDVFAPAASINSNIDLSNNQNVALAVANDADNGHVSNGVVVGGLSVSGTNINGTTGDDAIAMTGYPFTGMSTAADYSANNAQGNGREVAASVTTSVQNQDAVAVDTGGLQNGTANLSDNVSIAEARGNRASTAIDVTADANLAATSALLNTQVSDAGVISTADGSVNFALASDDISTFTGTVNNSSLSLEGNKVSALSVSNDATNVSNVSGTNVAAIDGDTASALFGGLLFTADATHVVNSAQASSGMTSATATGSVSADLVATDIVQGTSVSMSSVLLNGNVTAAEARGNNATNALVMDGSSAMGASGAVLNAQTRSITGSVSATATGNVTLTAMADPVTGVSAFMSSLGVTGNTTQALASANSASNTLTASAGSGYGTLSGIAAGDASSDTGSVSAAFGVLNGQSNDANVFATASATYSGNLLGDVTGSALNVNGNAVLASAVGNTASNGIVVNALPSGTPSAAVSSSQVNTGAIAALVSGTSIGLSASGVLGNGVVGSSLGVRGNTVSAGATGNSVVNSIKAR